MIRKLLVGVAALTLMPAAASAQTYDAFTQFNGTNAPAPGQNFAYGQIDRSGVNGSFFAANTGCFISGAICLQPAPNNTVPGFEKGGTPAQQGTVIVPSDRLLVHPNQDDFITSSIFVAPTAGRYNYTATFSVQDTNPSGIGINFLDATNGALPYQITALGGIGASGTRTISGGINLISSGDSFGFGIDRAGTYFNDSTGFNFTVTAVPEPATWGMMILGFGAMGYSMRRRRSSTLATA